MDIESVKNKTPVGSAMTALREIKDLKMETMMMTMCLIDENKDKLSQKIIDGEITSDQQVKNEVDSLLEGQENN